jgi:CheY-like chemotaxis protein
MNGTSTTVLLAGDTASRSATLRKWLGQRDCHCQFATSFVETCRMLSQREFDLVLCQYDLPDRTAFPLLDWLEGSPSSLIFARSGRGRRWLPVVEGGQRRLDRPLLRTIDLPNTLEHRSISVSIACVILSFFLRPIGRNWNMQVYSAFPYDRR